MGQILDALPLIGGRRQSLPNSPRRCRFEQLERRQLLAVDLTAGAADVPLVSPGGASASIHGSVFSAQSADCHTHSEASPRASMRVQLLDASGQLLEERLTGADGAYHFVDLLPGQYSVHQVSTDSSVEGSAVAGTGGGVALDAHLIGGIVVFGGENLENYDFCNVISPPEPSGPNNVRIVPHETVTIDQPFLPPPIPLVMTFSAVEVEADLFQPIADLTPGVQPPLVTVQLEASYSGGGRSLDEPASIKTWDEFQLDDWFSTTSHLEIAATDLPTIEALGSIIRSSEVASDMPFADGYTYSAVEWWEELGEFDLRELIDGGGEAVEQDADQPEHAPAHVAQRNRARQAE